MKLDLIMNQTIVECDLMRCIGNRRMINNVFSKRIRTVLSFYNFAVNLDICMIEVPATWNINFFKRIICADWNIDNTNHLIRLDFYVIPIVECTPPVCGIGNTCNIIFSKIVTVHIYIGEHCIPKRKCIWIIHRMTIFFTDNKSFRNCVV